MKIVVTVQAIYEFDGDAPTESDFEFVKEDAMEWVEINPDVIDAKVIKIEEVKN